jgi:hypothetical protein
MDWRRAYPTVACFSLWQGTNLLEIQFVVGISVAAYKLEIGSKRRTWTSADVRTLKSLARNKTRAKKIAKELKRTGGDTPKSI